VQGVQDEHPDLRLRRSLLRPLFHGPQQVLEGCQQRAARLLEPLAIRLADVLFEQQVEQCQLIIAQAFLDGTALFSVEARSQRHELSECRFDGGPVLLPIVVGDDLLVLPVVVHSPR